MTYISIFRRAFNADRTVFVVATRKGSNYPIAWKVGSEQEAQDKLDSEYEKCLVKVVGLVNAEALLKDGSNGLSEHVKMVLKKQVDDRIETLPDW